MPFLKCSVDEELKSTFLALAKSQSLTEAALLRILAKKVTGSTEETTETTSYLQRGNRITIRLTNLEMDAIVAKSKAEHFPNPSSYCTRIISHSLRGTPSANDDEVSSLRDSTRQLRAVGRNLNQIARVLNKDKKSFQESSKELSTIHGVLKSLSQLIKTHTEKNTELVNKIGERWS